jgi:hypothetical protein
MDITCRVCDEVIPVPDKLRGKRVQCPACGELVRVPDPQAAAAVAEFVDDEPGSVASQSCPMCGAANRVSARQCHACGEELAGGEEVIGAGLWREGRLLVMRKSAELPFVCVKTNQPADGWLRRKLYWHHPAIYLVALVNLIIYAIVAVCVQKKADIRVGLCRDRIVRRRWAIAIGWLSALAGLGLCIAGCAGLDTPGGEMAWLILAGLAVGFVGAITGLVLSSVVSPAKITDEFVWLKGVHPDFLEPLPEWPGEPEPRRRR